MVAGASTGDVRRLEVRDLASTSLLHVAELPDGFFSELGPRFVRAYHASFLGPHGIALVALVAGEAVGFVVGAADERAHLAWTVRRRGIRLVGAALVAFATRPGLALRFARTRGLRYVRAALRFARTKTSSAPPEGAAAASRAATAGVLSHVAVHPDHRGSGLGRALVDAFVDEARVKGVDRVRTMTKSGPGGAAGLYRALGWQPTPSRPDLDGTPFDHLEIRP